MQVLNGVGDGENFNLCLNYIFKRPLISSPHYIPHTQKRKEHCFDTTNTTFTSMKENNTL